MFANHGKEGCILDRVVGVDEAAIVHAAKLELPKGAVGLEVANLGQDRLRREAVPGLLGKAANRLKVATQVRQVLASGYRDHVVYVPFNEPEGNWYGTGQYSYNSISWLNDSNSDVSAPGAALSWSGAVGCLSVSTI